MKRKSGASSAEHRALDTLAVLGDIKDAVKFMLHRRQRREDMHELARIVEATLKLEREAKADGEQARAPRVKAQKQRREREKRR